MSLPHDSLDGLSPREVIMGFPMPGVLDWEDRVEPKPPKLEINRQEAHQLIDRLKTIHATARYAINKAQRQQTTQANKQRREPDFGVGDRVFIIKRGWITDRPSDKLDWRQTRIPYRIKAMRGYSYELEVPEGWRGATVYHADRLRKCADNPLPEQGNENPAGELVNGDQEEWEVLKVVTSKVTRGKLEYQVEWKGWDPDPEFWPASNFVNSAELLKEYHDANHMVPGPPKRLTQWLTGDKLDHGDNDKPAEGSRVGLKRRAVVRKK